MWWIHCTQNVTNERKVEMGICISLFLFSSRTFATIVCTHTYASVKHQSMVKHLLGTKSQRLKLTNFPKTSTLQHSLSNPSQCRTIPAYLLNPSFLFWHVNVFYYCFCCWVGMDGNQNKMAPLLPISGLDFWLKMAENKGGSITSNQGSGGHLYPFLLTIDVFCVSHECVIAFFFCLFVCCYGSLFVSCVFKGFDWPFVCQYVFVFLSFRVA